MIKDVGYANTASVMGADFTWDPSMTAKVQAGDKSYWYGYGEVLSAGTLTVSYAHFAPARRFRGRRAILWVWQELWDFIIS